MVVGVGVSITRKLLIDQIFSGIDPFASHANVSAVQNAVLPEGWGSTHPYFAKYIEMLKPKLIVEVGTWLGGSAVHMGNLLRAAGLNDSCIVCVDTWLGSPEHYLDPEMRRTLKLVDGRPTFYADFMQNVVQHGLQGIILPFSMTSTGAAEVLGELKIAPDLVYLDGDHSARAFRADLDLYWELLRPGGVVIGDDFDWKGPQAEVINFSWVHKLEFIKFENKFAIQKPA